MKISMFGLGKLGMPLAAVLANKGFEVMGVDTSVQVVNDVNNKHCWLSEPGVQGLLDSADNLTASHNATDAVLNTDISFIFVGTPNEGDGAFSTKYVTTVGVQIARALKNKDKYHLIVLRSTVLPGATQDLITLIEEVSGKECGKDFGMCHNPEMLALGTVVKDIQEPEFVFFGESDKKAGEILEFLYHEVVPLPTPILRTNLVNAEIAKLMVNNYVTTKMNFANMMAEMCEKIPGAEVDEVSRIVGTDSRVGRKFLSGGLSYGGTCFPRDNKALIYYLDKIGLNINFPKVIEDMNQSQPDRVVNLIEAKLGNLSGKQVAILGVTFKPDTDVIEESASMKIAKILIDKGARPILHDPKALDKAREVFGDKASYNEDIGCCINDTDLCILAVPWREYKNLSPEFFIKYMFTPVLLDCWRIYKDKGFKEKMKYFSIGDFI